MLFRRNAVEVWQIVRIEKRGGDLFLEKIDTLKVNYVTTSLKIHAIKSLKQVYSKQYTRNITGYICKVDSRGPHRNLWCEFCRQNACRILNDVFHNLDETGSVNKSAVHAGRAQTCAKFLSSFTAESDQIRKIQIFSNLRSSKLCTSHILVFGCLRGQDVIGS